jgi:hypothetical protein
MLWLRKTDPTEGIRLGPFVNISKPATLESSCGLIRRPDLRRDFLSDELRCFLQSL